jgi:hypothetical protein
MGLKEHQPNPTIVAHAQFRAFAAPHQWPLLLPFFLSFPLGICFFAGTTSTCSHQLRPYPLPYDPE